MKSFERENAKNLKDISSSGKPVTLVDNSREKTFNYNGTLRFVVDSRGSRYEFVDGDTNTARPIYKRDNLSFDYRSNGVIIEMDSSNRQNRRRVA